MEKAYNPIYDNKHCYDNRVDCAGNELQEIKPATLFQECF